MNKNTKITRLYFIILMLVTAAAVALRTVACLNDLEYRFGIFGSYTLITASGICAALGVLILFSYIFFSDKISAVPTFSSPSTYMPTALVAIALIFLSVALLSVKAPLDAAPRGLVVTCGILALVAVLHFFLNAFLTEAHTELRGYFSLASVIFLALYSAYLYFESTLPVNAPNKLVDQLAYLFSALFFLYEARISLGRERWRPYVAFGLIAALLTAYSSVPSLIVYFAKGQIISNSIEENILTLTLFIFICARIFMVAALKESTESSAIIGMRTFAKRREGIIAESMNVHKEAFAVQMTIDDLLPKPEIESEEFIPDDLPEADPEIIEEAPEQITLEMLLPEIDANEERADTE